MQSDVINYDQWDRAALKKEQSRIGGFLDQINMTNYIDNRVKADAWGKHMLEDRLARVTTLLETKRA